MIDNDSTLDETEKAHRKQVCCLVVILTSSAFLSTVDFDCSLYAECNEAIINI